MDKQPTKYDDDDGRVICDMDVEGMRWYDKRKRHNEIIKKRAISHDQLPNPKPVNIRGMQYLQLY
jgi:hypothetical protein